MNRHARSRFPREHRSQDELQFVKNITQSHYSIACRASHLYLPFPKGGDARTTSRHAGHHLQDFPTT